LPPSSGETFLAAILKSDIHLAESYKLEGKRRPSAAPSLTSDQYVPCSRRLLVLNKSLGTLLVAHGQVCTHATQLSWVLRVASAALIVDATSASSHRLHGSLARSVIHPSRILHSTCSFSPLPTADRRLIVTFQCGQLTETGHF
jgi:hypothetical protein